MNTNMHPQPSAPGTQPDDCSENSIYEPHPLRDGAPMPSRILPAMLSLAMTGLFLLGLNRGLFDSSEQRAPRPFSVHRSVRILLTNVTAPNRKYLGLPYRLHGGIRGAGHPDGTSTRDPLLTQRTKVETLSSDDFDPSQIHTLPTVDRSLQVFNPNLPIQAGGNGVAHGTGHDVARGLGSGPRFDHKIVLVHEVRISHRLQRGESADPAIPVRVRVEIGADGVPLEAVFVSGPLFLKTLAINAALQWRFEPLAPHGLSAPQKVVVNFWPVFTH